MKLACPFGDFLSDIFRRDNDSPNRAALGYHGPRPRVPERVSPSQIPGTNYGHCDYLPPDDLTKPLGIRVKVITWLSEALFGMAHNWPRIP